VPGSLETEHRLYVTAGQPDLLDGADIGASPPVARVGALDAVADAVAGLPADDALVLDALRDFLHNHPEVVYNPNDRSYSGYEGDYVYWDYVWVELTDWLDHSDGTDLYCHSMSCLLSTLAGHVGVDARQQILGHYFDTHLTRAAGTSDWQDWYFYSHSVVSPDGGATIWDAAVDLDGDGDPSRQPVDPIEASGLALEDYLALLTADDIGIVGSGRCYAY